MSTKQNVINFVLIGILVTFIASCKTDDYYYTNDFSTVPELPDTTNALSKTITDDGLIIYVIKEGDSTGNVQLTIRDQVYAYYTSRVAETGQILQSTYANGFTTPAIVDGFSNQAYIYYVSTTLFQGVEGMYPGEQRVLVFPEELTTAGTGLIIDFELYSITY